MPVAVAQLSVVQTSPSSQSASARQQPATGVWVHWPSASSQVSVVQTDASLQSGGVPAMQALPAGLQVSTPLQKRPSLQRSVWWQTCWAVSHVSAVQALPSSQSASILQQPATAGKAHIPLASTPSPNWPSSQASGVPLQLPAWQMSSSVQGFMSSQAALLSGWRQLPAPSHWSSVQTLPSSVQPVPAGVRQLRAVSLHVSLHSA